MSEVKQRNTGLDIVRAFAIIIVMLHHWLPSVPWILPKRGHYFLILGYYGVEIFFVLSGFLIGNILIRSFANETFSIHSIYEFWFRRWFRTLPLYFFMLLVNTVVYVFIQNKLIVDFWKYPFFLQNFFSYNNSFFGITWSLSVEEWFYLSFPMVLLVTYWLFPESHSKKEILKVVIISYLTFFLGMRLVFAQIEDLNWNNDIRKSVFFRLDSIAFGVLASYIYQYSNSFWLRHRMQMFYVGLFILSLCAIIFFKDISRNYGYGQGDVSFFGKTIYISFVGVGAMLILPLLMYIDVENKSIKFIITWISKLSYSLYLVHVIVMDLINGIRPVVYGYHALLSFGVYFLLSIGISIVTYNVIEVFFFKVRDRAWKASVEAV